MIKVGVIGYGYWGPNLVRNFMEAPGSTVVAVCDLRSERLAQLRSSLSDDQDRQQLSRRCLHDPNIDAIVIATPVSSHFDLAMAALKAGQACAGGKTSRGKFRAGYPVDRRSGRRRKRVDGGPHVRLHQRCRKIRELITANASAISTTTMRCALTSVFFNTM